MFQVLIVEDEEMIRKGIIMTVDWAALDCRVAAEASDGLEALEAVEKYRPNLIITDLKMPRMSGLEMLEELRARGNSVPVIILTAYDNFNFAQSALRLGAVDYILKPFHDGDLEQAVTRLSRRLAAESASPAPAPVPESFPGLSSGNLYVLGAARFVAEHYADPDLSLTDIAAAVGLSESRLSHLFKNESGLSVFAFLTRYRMERASEFLRDCRHRISEVACLCGYRNIAHFSALFKKTVGLSPSEYRNRAGKKDEA